MIRHFGSSVKAVGEEDAQRAAVRGQITKKLEQASSVDFRLLVSDF
jgi:hypothetical protein